MSNKDLIEQLRKASGVGQWTRAMITAADRLEASDSEIYSLRQQLASRDAEILQLQKLADEVHAARKVNAEHDRLLVKIAAKDAEIADLLEANCIACEDLVEQQNLRVKYAGQIAELVAALELLSKYIAYNGDDWVQRTALEALAKVRKP